MFIWYSNFQYSPDMLVIGVSVRVMVFNTTFNNISVLSWRSVLLAEETSISGEYWKLEYHMNMK
jgi:hypothetical protein